MICDPKMRRKQIDRALPTRWKGPRRQALIDYIDKECEKWTQLAPQIEPHADKIRRLVRISKQAQKAMGKVADALSKLGAEKDIENARAARVALGIDPTRAPLGGYSATLDLYLIAWRAMDRLRTWDRLYRPAKGTPQKFSVSLTTNLRYFYGQIGGSEKELEDLLESLDLPKLTTLKKRTARARKRAKTK